MRFQITHTCFCFLLLQFVGTGSAGEGTVRGKVVDTSGQPVVGAMVSAKRLGVPLARAIEYVSTDQGGLFTIRGLEWGTYGIFANKEEDGYPNTSFQFYSNG